MATLVKIKEVQFGGQMSDAFYLNVDQIIEISTCENGLYNVQDNDRCFNVDKENLDIILNACNVVS